MNITISQEGMNPITVSTDQNNMNQNYNGYMSMESGAEGSSDSSSEEKLPQGFSGITPDMLNQGYDPLTGEHLENLTPERIQEMVANGQLPESTLEAMNDPNATNYEPSYEEPEHYNNGRPMEQGFSGIADGQHVDENGYFTPDVHRSGDDLTNAIGQNGVDAYNDDIRRRAMELKDDVINSRDKTMNDKSNELDAARSNADKQGNIFKNSIGKVPSSVQEKLANSFARSRNDVSDATDAWNKAFDAKKEAEKWSDEKYEDMVKNQDLINANKSGLTRQDAEGAYRSKHNQEVYDTQKAVDAARTKLADMELDPNTTKEEIEAQKDTVDVLQRKADHAKNEIPKYGIPSSQAAAMSGYRNDAFNQRRMPMVGGMPSNPKAGLASNTEGTWEPPATTAYKEKQADKQAKVAANVAAETEAMRKARAASGHVPSMDPTIEQQRQANEAEKAKRALKEREILNSMIMNNAPREVIEQQKKVVASYDPIPMKPSSAGMPANVADGTPKIEGQNTYLTDEQKKAKAKADAEAAYKEQQDKFNRDSDQKAKEAQWKTEQEFGGPKARTAANPNPSVAAHYARLAMIEQSALNGLKESGASEEEISKQQSKVDEAQRKADMARKWASEDGVGDDSDFQKYAEGQQAETARRNAFGNMPSVVQEYYGNNKDSGNNKTVSQDKIDEINKSRQATGTNPLAKTGFADKASNFASGVASSVASTATNPENLKKAGVGAAILVAADFFLRRVLGGTIVNAVTSIGKFKSGKEMLASPKLNQNLMKVARKYQKPYPTVDEVKASPNAKSKDTFVAWLLGGQSSNQKISSQIGSTGTLIRATQSGIPVAVTTLSSTKTQALQQLGGLKVAIATAFFKKNGQIVSEPVARGFLAKGSMVNASREAADIFFNARGQKFTKKQIQYLANKTYESFGPVPELESKIIDWYCL